VYSLFPLLLFSVSFDPNSIFSFSFPFLFLFLIKITIKVIIPITIQIPTIGTTIAIIIVVECKIEELIFELLLIAVEVKFVIKVEDDIPFVVDIEVPDCGDEVGGVFVVETGDEVEYVIEVVVGRGVWEVVVDCGVVDVEQVKVA